MQRRIGILRQGNFTSAAIDFPKPESDGEKRFQELVKKHVDATGQNLFTAEYAVALTPEGQKAWEEARKARLKKG
jgi:phage terminase Nu1 subunit (DNA packaging protein)